MAKIYMDNGSELNVKNQDISNIESRLMRGRQLNYYKTKDEKHVIFLAHVAFMERDIGPTEESEEDTEERVLAEIVAEQNEQKPNKELQFDEQHKCKFEYRFRTTTTGATQYFKYCPLCGKQSRVIAKKDISNPDEVRELKG